METNNNFPSEPQHKSFNHWFWLAVIAIVLVGGGIIYALNMDDSIEVVQETKDWKTYTSPLGYSINYPATWIVIQSEEEVRPVNPDIDNGMSAQYFKLRIEDQTLDQLREGLKKTIAGRDVIESEITLGGEKAFAYTEKFPLFYESGQIRSLGYEVIVQHNGKVFYLWTQKYNLSEVKQIFASFKFTDSVSTADWKTYTNVQYGFQVQYPANWTVTEDGYVYFQSLDYKKLLDNNNKYCSDNNPMTECLSEPYGQSVTFSAELGDRDSKQLKGQKIFNGVTFDKYVDGGLFGDYTTYVTLHNGINYTFTTDEGNLPHMEEILSSFKFTK